MDTFGVPLKKASDVDVLKPLKNLILSRYSTAESESYISAINDLAKLRQIAVIRALDYHDSSLEVIYRYYDQLVALENKIPASEIQIPFKWKDAFDKGSIFGGRISLTVASLGYEKVCVLFNIAALQTQVAAVQSTDSDESMKSAFKLFQSASGIFAHLKNTVHGSLQQEPTPDLQPDTLGALAALQLAQAQEVITVKAIKDKMKDNMLAKLCNQCEELYTDAMKHLQREILKPLWDRDWVTKVCGKQAGFHGLAEYHQSKVCNADKIIGEEIARLRHAIELFKAAQTRSGDLTMFADELARAQRAHDEAVKDNDFIYHERIPDLNSLPSIGKAPIAKSTPLADKFCSNFTDMFESLVPVPVQQAMVQFDTRKQEIVNSEINKMRESTMLLNSILASLNLPAAIEDTGTGQLPPSLRDKSSSVCQNGGIESIQKMITELPELLIRNKELLDEAEKQLKEERDSDDQLRSQFKERWQRTPSEKLTQTFQTNADKYRKVIDTAMNADGKIRQKFEDNLEGMQLLSEGPDNLAASLPMVSGSTSNNSSPGVLKLRELMETVETLKAERDAIESELKCATTDMKGEFLRALGQDGAINEPVMSTESLGRAYGELQRQVKDSLASQETLLANIQNAHTEFSRSGNGEGEREATLKKLASSYDAFNQLNDNLKEGTKFYNDLTQLLVTFQGKIADYCFARRTEKEELLKDLTQGLANQSISAAPATPTYHQEAAKSTPPSRPPPPALNPFASTTPGAPPAHSAPAAPPLAQAPVAPPGVPPQQPGVVPYPINPQGMPTPQGYAYNSYPVYTPMPMGYNPYFQQQPPAGFGGYTAPPYPQQHPPHPAYPQQQQQQQPNPAYPQQQQQQQNPAYPYSQQQQQQAPSQQWPPRT